MTSVTVMMPTYNQARFLDRALEALEAQTYKYFNVIVCDDGSTDYTAEVLNRWLNRCNMSLTVVTHDTNKGTAEAINTAAREADGRLWTWVSSDNVMHPEWLSTLVAKMSDGVGAAYSAFTYLQDKNPRLRRIIREPYHPEKLLSGEKCYYGPSFLIRADVWRIAGPHRGKASHDYDHWARVEEVCMVLGYRIVYVDEPLCDYYSGPWGTVRRDPSTYDAPHWRQEAIKRRKDYRP